MESKIIDCVWINSIGIVKVQDPVSHEIEFYIGVGDGLDQERDERYIADHGSKVYKNFIKKFFEI